MKFDPTKAREDLDKLKAVLKSREGKTLTQAAQAEVYQRLRRLETFLRDANQETLTKILERVSLSASGEWHFDLPEGESVRVYGDNRVVVQPWAANVAIVTSE
jgi:hypothetical protein